MGFEGWADIKWRENNAFRRDRMKTEFCTDIELVQFAQTSHKNFVKKGSSRS